MMILCTQSLRLVSIGRSFIELYDTLGDFPLILIRMIIDINIGGKEHTQKDMINYLRL